MRKYVLKEKENVVIIEGLFSDSNITCTVGIRRFKKGVSEFSCPFGLSYTLDSFDRSQIIKLIKEI